MRPSSTQGSITASVITQSGVNFVQFTSGSNTVQLVSGTNFVSVSGLSISGQAVNISGNAVGISGQAVNVSGNVVKISGETITLAGSIQASISGSPVTISGNSVSVSGNIVTISGNNVYISGSVTTITSVSGNVVSLSGLWSSTTLQSGQTGVSGGIGALNYAYDLSGLKWSPLTVDISGSRTLSVTVSGDPVSVSGNAVTASGNVVNISGSIVQPSYSSNTSVRGRNVLSLSAASGGTVLNSGDCSQITIRALSGNAGPVYVGGVTGTEVPWGVTQASGKGMVLGPGDGMTFPISNMNLVAVTCYSGAGGSNSGDKISYMGVQY